MMVAGLSPFPEKKWMTLHFLVRDPYTALLLGTGDNPSYMLFLYGVSFYCSPIYLQCRCVPQANSRYSSRRVFQTNSTKVTLVHQGVAFGWSHPRYLYRRYPLRSQTRKRPNPSKKPLDDWKITCCFNIISRAQPTMTRLKLWFPPTWLGNTIFHLLPDMDTASTRQCKRRVLIIAVASGTCFHLFFH